VRDFITLLEEQRLRGGSWRSPQKNLVHRIAVLFGASTANIADVERTEKFSKELGWSPGRDLRGNRVADLTGRLLALSGREQTSWRGPLSGVKPTSLPPAPTSENDPGCVDPQRTYHRWDTVSTVTKSVIS
jgi:hypothetical protein